MPGRSLMVSRRGSRGVMVVAAMIALLVVSHPAAAQAQRRADDAQETAQRPPRQVTIAVAISALRRELNDPRMRNESGWPRTEINFAQDKNWTVDQRQLKRAFTRPLDQNPTADGYLRWQMLSFEPDFSRYTDDELRRVVSTMPDYWGAPRVTFAQTATGVNMTFQSWSGLHGPRPVVGNGAIGFNPSMTFVGTGTAAGGNISGFAIGDGVDNDPQMLDERRRTEVRQANYALQTLREDAQRANEPIRWYRTELIERLPVEDGVRLGAKMRDVMGLLQAGDETMDEALDELIAMAERESGHPSIDNDVRIQMGQWVRQLDDYYTDVHVRLGYDAHGWAVNLLNRLALDDEKMVKLAELIRRPPVYEGELTIPDAAEAQQEPQ